MRSPLARLRALAGSSGPARSRVPAALLAVLYLAQLATPLRLWADGIVYLSMAASAAEGQGFLYQGRPGAYPRGYPALVALLDRAGLACSASFVAINLLCLALALWIGHRLCRASLGLDRSTYLWICCWACLSWVTIKHALLPATDTVFFGLSMSCLYLLVRAEQEPAGRGYLARMAGACLLIAAAFLVRSAALALFPPFLLVAWRGWSAASLWRTGGWARRCLLWAGPLVLLLSLAALIAPVVARSSYFAFAHAMWTSAPWDTLVRSAVGRWLELGCLVVNVPAARIPPALGPWFAAAGCPVSLVVVWYWWRRRRAGALEVFVLSYLGLLCVWPPIPPDPRLWLPLLTLLPALLTTSWRIRRWPATIRRLALGYLLAFGLIGAGALLYATRVSWSGQAFPERYGAPTLRPAYRAALGSSEPLEPSEIDADVVRLLRRYELRARRR